MTDCRTDFIDFVAERQRALLRLAMVLTGDTRLAEDLVADVLARAYEKWQRIGAAEQPYAYVRRMIVNEYLSWRRRSARAAPFAELDGYLPAVPDHAGPVAERAQLIAQLSTLPRKQRATLVLRYFEGLSDGDIALTLACRESTVRSNAARGLAALRIALSPTVAPISQEA